jgi:hypothetical protein
MHIPQGIQAVLGLTNFGRCQLRLGIAQDCISEQLGREGTKLCVGSVAHWRT